MSWIRWIRRVEAGFGGHVGDNLGREGGWCVWTRRILGFTRVPHVSDASGASCGNRTLRAALLKMENVAVSRIEWSIGAI